MKNLVILVTAFLIAGCATSIDDNNGFPNDNNGTPGDNNGQPVNNTECVSPPCSTDNSTCIDNDGDGFGINCALGIDCDDTNVRRAPNLVEVCDGIDNDCTKAIDDGIDCSNCNDIDGDGFGEGCPGGLDCDESDTTIYNGAPELCDGKDNDCDLDIDEDFTDFGMTCEAGLGECMNVGMMVCGPNGSLVCDAMPGAAIAEICDTLDNDCNGLPDDGVDCGCQEDQWEPNESSTTGTGLEIGQLTGQSCDRNIDWFRLGNYAAGQNVSVELLFSHAEGDLEMEMFVGSTFEAGAYSGTNNESISKTLSKSGNVTVRVYLDVNDVPSNSGTSYTIRRP